MKPVLKISRIKDLHDARYCSAVGINLLSFRMEPLKPETVEAKAVAEIIGWLSGPEYIGEMGYLPPDEVAKQLETVSLDYIELPLDYPVELAGELSAKIIFRAQDVETSLEETLKKAETLSESFPAALFEVDLNAQGSPESLLNSPLLDRMIIGYDQPDEIYSLMRSAGKKPFGFALGSFIEEEDGIIDYEKCDDFLETFLELVEA